MSIIPVRNVNRPAAILHASEPEVNLISLNSSCLRLMNRLSPYFALTILYMFSNLIYQTQKSLQTLTDAHPLPQPRNQIAQDPPGKE
jgi:hypothetical protein